MNRAWIALVLTVQLAGCDSASRAMSDLFDPGTSRELPPAVAARHKGTLFVGRAADAIGLDPARYTDNESVEVCEQIFDHLVRYREGSTDVAPALATSWDVSGDGLAWTFHLRRGVKFHDGTDFDAEAVRFSFERQLDKNHPYHMPDFLYWQTNYATIVKSIDVVDPLTVRITLFRSYAPFLSILAMFPVSIVSPAAVEKWGPEFPEHPIGTGPFKFDSWTHGDRIVLERNDGYWDGRPRLDRIVFRYIADARQRLVELEGGAIDVAYGLLPEELQYVQLHPDLQLLKTAGENVAYLAMHTQKPPFDNVVVRQAVNYAVNKVPIVKLVYQGLAVPATGALPPTMWGYRKDVQDYPYDPGKAKALLDQEAAAGRFDASKRYTIYVPRQPRVYLPNPELVGRVIQQNLEAVGVKTDLVVQDLDKDLADVEIGKHDLCILGWAADNSDPDNFLYLLLDSDNAIPGLARNVAFYINPHVHGLLSWAQSTNDRAERERDYGQAQELIAADAPWVPLAHSQVAVAAHTNVQALTIHPSSIIYYDKVWIGP
jgi:peptide/nickel transport system substrate-binding protein